MYSYWTVCFWESPPPTITVSSYFSSMLCATEETIMVSLPRVCVRMCGREMGCLMGVHSVGWSCVCVYVCVCVSVCVACVHACVSGDG